MCKLSKDHKIKVLLDGQGADEQLCGYPVFLGINFSILLFKFKFFKLCKELLFSSKNNKKSIIWSCLYLFDTILPDYIREKIRFLFKKNKSNPIWLDLNVLDITPKNPIPLKILNINKLSDFSKVQIFK